MEGALELTLLSFGFNWELSRLLNNVSYLYNINFGQIPIFLSMVKELIMSKEGTTQGDPLAMAFYAISTEPLINSLTLENVKHVWYADTAVAVGDLLGLRCWWDNLAMKGPKYGYFPNALKT